MSRAAVPRLVRLAPVPPVVRKGRAFAAGYPAPTGSTRRPSNIHDLAAMQMAWSLNPATRELTAYVVTFSDRGMCRGFSEAPDDPRACLIAEVGDPSKVAEEMRMPTLHVHGGWCDIHSGRELWTATVYREDGTSMDP